MARASGRKCQKKNLNLGLDLLELCQPPVAWFTRHARKAESRSQRNREILVGEQGEKALGTWGSRGSPGKTGHPAMPVLTHHLPVADTGGRRTTMML